MKRNLVLGGSYTIEAAFIMPLIIGILFAWLFQLFYLHDLAVLDGMLKEAVIQEVEEKEKQTNQKNKESQYAREEKKLNQSIQEILQSHLWIMKITLINRKKELFQTKYKVCAETEWRIPVLNGFLGNHFTCKLSDDYFHIHPEKMLRLQGEEKETEEDTR